MRILNIRLMNLNSLSGEWQIDFTHPDYEAGGIFAITGPTGSGKTTILDAICLALYGRTPRLDKVTKSTNEIMSRQAGDCYAEVTFETQKGRYRCHWSQRRARKKTDGELQQSRHEIADALSGMVLESKINQVGGFIEKVTGMDYERFTRSMLLAQGGFAAFLQASPDKRAPILEQITGTEIYSLISIKTHERNREELEKLDLLQAELKGIRILNEEEEQKLAADLRENQDRERELSEKNNTWRQFLAWIECITALSGELEALNRKTAELAARRQLFEPEAKKLQMARQALAVEGEYKEVATLRRKQEVDENELKAATAFMPEKETALANALQAKEKALQSLDQTRAWQTQSAEIINKVRELDARFNEKKKHIEQANQTLLSFQKQADDYKSSIVQSTEALKQSQTASGAVDDYLRLHAVDAALAAQLAALGQSFKLLSDREARHAQACKNLLLALGKKNSADVALQKIEADNDNLREEFGRKQSQQQELNDQFSAILQGREINQWRDSLDAFKEHLRSLENVLDVSGRIEATKKTLLGLSANLETFQNSHNLLYADIKAATLSKANLDREIEHAEIQVSLLCRICDLEEDRKRLEDGKPCPLCGAIDHPYARGNVPQLNQAENALKNLKKEFKKESGILSKLEADFAKKDADIRHAEKDMAEKQAELNTLEMQCAAALRGLNITVAPEAREALIQSGLANAKTSILEVSNTIAAAETVSVAAKKLQADLEKMREKVENSGKNLQEAQYLREMATNDHQRLINDAEVLAGEVENMRASVLRDVTPFGILEIAPERLTDVLKELTRRKNTWEAKQNEKNVCEKKINDIKALMDKEQALLASLENSHAQSGKERDDLMMQYDSLVASRWDLFEDKNPDQVEKSLAAAVLQADQHLEKIRELCGQIEKEISAREARIGLTRKNLESRATDLRQAGDNLKNKLAINGFEKEDDYLLAALRSSERELLEIREKELIKETTELEARRQDKAEALESQRNKNLTDLTGDVIRQNIDQAESLLREIRLNIGALTKSLTDNRQQKEIQKDRLQNIESQQNECLRWSALHDLIGSADGKKFRNFAQGLTFEIMTRQANRQLRKMTDRYLLVRDTAAPLELNVIDNYQAGEVRSTKNLSGGESFIVSLALALGLSRMASHNVRVDSLFLDEGFGALDDDALETALDTLAELQQDGKLIGVISHVPALKERISTQIQVATQTGGRSTLAGPGCRRL